MGPCTDEQRNNPLRYFNRKLRRRVPNLKHLPGLFFYSPLKTGPMKNLQSKTIEELHEIATRLRESLAKDHSERQVSHEENERRVAEFVEVMRVVNSKENGSHEK